MLPPSSGKVVRMGENSTDIVPDWRGWQVPLPNKKHEGSSAASATSVRRES